MAEVAQKAGSMYANQQTFKEVVADIMHEQKDWDLVCKELLNLARITEAAERYEDMCYLMGQVVKQKKNHSFGLTVEERNMLSVAYKNVVGQHRAAWRTLSADEAMNEEKLHYKDVLEAELEDKCNEVLGLLKANLLKSKEAHGAMLAEKAPVKDGGNNKEAEAFDALETQVFYLKMSGDYYRYLAEFKQGEDTKKSAETSYDNALKLSEKLPPTHPTRLGLALNASVCYWEILHNPDKACNLAKKAFDEAIQKLDSLSDATYKDSTLIMQLLRDNLTIWTTETQDGNKTPDEQPED